MFAETEVQRTLSQVTLPELVPLGLDPAHAVLEFINHTQEKFGVTLIPQMKSFLPDYGTIVAHSSDRSFLLIDNDQDPNSAAAHNRTPEAYFTLFEKLPGDLNLKPVANLTAKLVLSGDKNGTGCALTAALLATGGWVAWEVALWSTLAYGATEAYSALAAPKAPEPPAQFIAALPNIKPNRLVPLARILPNPDLPGLANFGLVIEGSNVFLEGAEPRPKILIKVVSGLHEIIGVLAPDPMTTDRLIITVGRNNPKKATGVFYASNSKCVIPFYIEGERDLRKCISPVLSEVSFSLMDIRKRSTTTINIPNVGNFVLNPSSKIGSGRLNSIPERLFRMNALNISRPETDVVILTGPNEGE